MGIKLEVAYLSTSKLHRNRANLIQTLHTVSALSDLGCNITVFISPWKNLSLQERLDALGIRKNFKIIGTQLLHSRWKILGYRPFVWNYRKALENSDFVFCRSLDLSMLLGSFEIRHVLEIHSIEDLRQKNLLADVIISHQKGIITYLFPINKTAFDSLSKAGAVEERMRVVPSGVDIDSFRFVRPVPKANLLNPVIGHIGTISMDRGGQILEVLAKSNLGRIISVGEKRGKLHSMKNVSWYPPVAHCCIPFIYNACDIIVIPYQKNIETYESMSPLKLFESLASGRPIIASDIPALREIIQDKQDALLVPPEDPKAWIEAVKFLKAHPDVAIEMGKNARKKAFNYSWEKRAKKILTCLNSIYTRNVISQ